MSNEGDTPREASMTIDEAVCGRCGHTAHWHSNFGHGECQVYTGCDCHEFKLAAFGPATDGTLLSRREQIQALRAENTQLQQRLDEQAAELHCGGSGFIAIPPPSPGPPEGEFCRGCPDCEPSPAVQRRITKLEQQLAERTEDVRASLANIDGLQALIRDAEAKVQQLEAEIATLRELLK